MAVPINGKGAAQFVRERRYVEVPEERVPELVVAKGLPRHVYWKERVRDDRARAEVG